MPDLSVNLLEVAELCIALLMIGGAFTLLVAFAVGIVNVIRGKSG